MKRKTLLACLFYSLLLVPAYRVSGEGTNQVMPNAANGTGLIVSTTATFPLGNVGTYLGAPKDDRIYFHIKNFSVENLYCGFNWETLAPNGTIVPYTDVYMNIYDPTGALVITVPLTGAGAGFISTYASAMAGPNIGGATPAGYTPYVFTPNQNGDYYVSFYRSSNGGVTHRAGGESMLSKYFDLTVAQTNNTQYPGRVHCNEWAFSVYNPAKGDQQDPLASTNAQFFAYTSDSVDTKIYFPASGFEPLSYIIAVNSFGVQNTGNWLNDRKSINLPNLVSPYLTGGYDVFLNVPDPTLYPTCTIPNPPSLVSPTISGCPPGPYNVRFNAPQAGDYYMVFDLNGIPGYQSNSADLYVELINQTPGIITYVWNGKDGLGNTVPANTTFPITFSYRKGRINLPFYDVELNINGFSVDAVAPQAELNTTLYWDDSQLTSMGTECTTSNNNNYTGIGYTNSILGQASPGHAWNGDGNPGFLDPAPPVVYTGVRNDSDNIQCNDFGNARLINTWAWGIVLNTTQNLTLTCLNISGTVWDDADGSANGTFTNIRTNSETGTNAGNTLFASLIDPVTGTVLATTTVNANGTYTLNSCPINATGMKIVISTTAGVVGSPAPATALPSNWVNTSPLINTFNTVTTNVTGIDFGIEQLPNSTNENYTIATPVLNTFRTLNGAGTIASPGPVLGTDPEDGNLSSGKTVVITQVPSNEQLYYAGVLVTNNTKITSYNTSMLQVKFTNITTLMMSFQYAYIDAAGQQDPTPATYTINFSTVLQTTISSLTGYGTVQGNVLNWTALDETNGVDFIVERSTDGIDFEPIGQIEGSNDGASGNHVFTDAHPIAGITAYYRLQESDAGGSIYYSNIVMIAPVPGRSAADVAPNPFRDVINVNVGLANAGKISIRLLDSKGMVLQRMEIAGAMGANTIQVKGLSSLPVSVYFVQIILPDQVIVKKVFNQ